MDLFAKMLDYLKSSDIPTIIYGASVRAEIITNWLEKKGVTIDGYAVDEKYYPKDSSFNGKPIYILEQYLSKNLCNVIVGFIGFTQEKENELKTHKNIRKCYFLDFGGRFVLRNCDCRINEDMMEKNKDILQKLRDDLADEESKLSLDRYIYQNTTGTYPKEYTKKPVYFDDDIITLCENETFIDCGAYDGDTILEFTKAIKTQEKSAGYKKVIAFEADPTNAEKMKNNLAGLENIEIITKGVSDKAGVLHFAASGSVSSSIVSENGIEIEVTTIDETVKDENVTFIKMDIEGSELKALTGARNTIKQCRPKLAICVYHKAEDLMTIPQYIQSLVPDYKLYLRNYSAEGIETVLYAL
ncbi:MAG: FkbM family methyltransferase [Oscillospiraceae bacterium]|nr:FkbM family methyltransferase [Oscillospiraceae bacterium]